MRNFLLVMKQSKFNTDALLSANETIEEEEERRRLKITVLSFTMPLPDQSAEILRNTLRHSDQKR